MFKIQRTQTALNNQTHAQSSFPKKSEHHKRYSEVFEQIKANFHADIDECLTMLQVTKESLNELKQEVDEFVSTNMEIEGESD